MSFFKNFIKTVQREYFQVEPFLEVIYQENMEKFDYFMKEKVTRKNINYFNNQRVGALGTALEVRNIEMIEKLLQAGANPNFVNFEDETLFLTFSRNIISQEKVEERHQKMLDRYYDNIHYMGKIKSETLPLVDYEKEGLTIVKLMQQYGADIHAKDSEGNNALIYCMHEDFVQSAIYLIQEKVNFFQKNNLGVSALSIAVKKKICIEEIIDSCKSKDEINCVTEAMKKNDELIEQYGDYLNTCARRHSLEEQLPQKPMLKAKKI